MTLADVAHKTATVAAGLPDRRARTCTHLATLLHHRLPTAQHNITLELGCLDGWPTSTPGAPNRGTRPRGGISRPTETVALNRLGHRNDGPASDHADLYETVVSALDAIHQAADRTGIDRDDWLRATESFLRQAHRIADRHMGRSDHDPDAHRCKGTGDATGATCTQLADYRYGDGGILLPAADGRCIDCHHAVEAARAEEAERAEAAARQKIADRETRRRARRRAG